MSIRHFNTAKFYLVVNFDKTFLVVSAITIWSNKKSAQLNHLKNNPCKFGLFPPDGYKVHLYNIMIFMVNMIGLQN